MQRYSILVGAVALSASITLHAQDTRTVTEPTVPPACVSLDAQLILAGHTLGQADESKLDTLSIQQALDGCSAGHAVVLEAHAAANAFLSGPLILRDGVTLVVDQGTTLLASRDPALYEISPGSCGIVNDAPGQGCKPLLSAQHITGAGIMGDGTIDGRGGEKLLGKNVSWWDLAEQARPNRRQQVSRLLVANAADNFTIYRISLTPPNFHVVYNHGDGFTVWGLKIDTPKRLARNTDGVDPGSGSKNITITHSFIRTGDDNVAIKGGPGGVTNMTVSHNYF